jgi:putative toxin-antitoxin system antitoxin component (TIGR02293 family)
MAKKQVLEKKENRGKSVLMVRAKTALKYRQAARSRGADGTIHVKISDTKKIADAGKLKYVILGEASKKPESQMTAIEKMDLVRVGVTKSALEKLKSIAALDYDQLARILSVARATLINKKGAAKFNNALSEKIVGLADIYSYGYEVFEAEDRFNQWMFRPNQALNGQTPFDLIDNQYGREEVKDLIGRIDYGVYS